MKYEIKEYFNYEEYKLIDLYPVEKIHYRRGNSLKNFFSIDFKMWQDYFCEDYTPPEGCEILLFHCCSWSKPYDFSYIVNPIRNVAKKYNKVHRAILSNVGVVPYEYQMNPTFCSYDFPPIYDTTGLQLEEISSMREEIIKISYERILRYLKKHKNHYKKVITLGTPVKYGIAHIVATACSELNIPCENVINKDLYHKYKDKGYRDNSEIFIEKEVLESLDKILKRTCSELEK